MTVQEFREKIKPLIKLSIEGKDFLVKEVVKFRFDDGSFYIKCWISDDYVFADDLNENNFLLVKEVKTPFVAPFAQELEFDNKKFSFLYSAHAIAEEIQGEEIFKKGEGERFWDYRAEDNSYLSLGTEDKTGERADFYGKIIDVNLVEIHDSAI
ncbi:MAG: DUF4178 domain-containing protein [Candidatus Staskawiczbacteria bacterium]|nr:DUF4178 domain-containing protein [Candidatus Staskawiczbacteria bacterium]